tara:strand:+ start:651 stop:842 length:192 start_codon:yes stop_codon:yes gene_type:complete
MAVAPLAALDITFSASQESIRHRAGVGLGVGRGRVTPEQALLCLTPHWVLDDVELHWVPENAS